MAKIPNNLLNYLIHTQLFSFSDLNLFLYTLYIPIL